MRVSIRRFALTLALPAAMAAPALAQGAYDDGQPPAAIALFTGTDYYGDVREAFDPFASMHDLAFNDRARSVAVLAGQWELCEHANFTGRCVFVREDVPDLGWFGLEGRVSSIRPIYDYTEAQHGLMFTRDDNGYIRYAHNESWGSSGWNYGYSSSVRLSVQHYGYSPDYWRFGYYDPRWGYDPYGFAWRPYGGPRYVSYTYRVHPRPVYVNSYWQKHWGKDHKYWDRRGDRDDWRRKPGWRDHDGGRGPGRGPGRDDGKWDGGRDRDWNRDRGGGRPGGWNRDRDDDRRGDRPGAGRDGPPRTDGRIPTDPRRGEGGGRGDWRPSPGGGSAVVTPPSGGGRDRGEGGWRGGSRDGTRGDRGDRGDRGGWDRGDRGGREGRAGSGSRPEAGLTPPVSSPVTRPDRGSGRPGGDGWRGRREDSLLGGSGGSAPVASPPGRGGGEGRGGRGDGGRRGGGDFSRPAATPPAAPQTAVAPPSRPPRVESGRGRGGGERGGERGPRRLDQ